jgi:hypothetical protein
MKAEPYIPGDRFATLLGLNVNLIELRPFTAPQKSTPRAGFRAARRLLRISMMPLPLLSSATSRRAFSVALNLGFALIAFSCAAYAQTSRPGLISQAVNESKRIQLRGNVNPAATRSADRGIVPASMAADRMILLLKRSPEQERALRADIEAMHNSKSPSFHKWLTPQQFGAKWGAADSDIAAVTAWLQSHGFKVQGPSAGRTTIEFSGTAGQLKEAFHTEIHSYMVNGELHHANATDPQIPAALAPVVAGVTSMNDFRPRSSARSGKRIIYNTETRKARPALTESGDSGNFLLVGPSDAATIYNSPNKALNPAATGTTYDGTGAKIGIINDSNISLAQDANYRAIFGLSAKAPTVILAGDDPGENGDALEAYLDVELAGAIAPGATVYLYTSADNALNHGIDLAIIRAVNDNLADILNLSFTACEGSLGQVLNEFYANLWEQAAAQGISVTVATGDSGSANCDNPNTQTEATGGLQVNGLASSAYNIAVGGTDFGVLIGPDGTGSDFTKYVSIGSDPTTLRTALGYIPEVAWNASSSTFPPGAISTNVPWADPNANIAATGGGKSQCVIAHQDQNGNLICESGYPKPSWQSAPGVPADSARDIPDVSLFSAAGYDLAAWGICTDLQVDNNNSPVSDCTPGSDGLPSDEFYIQGVGGTSAAAPAFAGMLALVKQATGERQGQASYVLYNLARNAPAVFHDINPGTTVPGGNNAVPCTAGTPGCVKNAAGFYYMSANETTTGYDLATGLGSVDVSALISNWSAAALATSSTTLTITPTSFQHGTVATVVATVTSASGSIPTGQVAISAEANPPSLPLSQVIGTYDLDATGSTGPILINSMPGGTYKAVASYSGSEILTGSVSAPVQMSITPEPSIVIIGASVFDPITGASPAGFTFPYGDYIGYTAQIYGKNSPVINGQVVPDGVPTGNVTFKANSVVLDADPIGLDGVAESINHNLSPATYVITGQYPGDNSFLPNSSAQTMTITKGATQISLQASATKYTGTPIDFTVALTTRSIAAAPTGTVALIAKTATGSITIASAPLVGLAASGPDLSSGTVTISTSNLPTSNSEITAVYEGDVNYASSTSNSIAVTAKPTFSITGSPVTLPNEHSTAAAILTVRSLNGYSGTINYSCALISQSASGLSPLCSMNPASSALSAGATTEPILLIYGMGSKIPKSTTSSNRTPLGLGLGAGATVLACCVFFGIPARRRKWQSLLSAILMLAALGSLSACVSSSKLIPAGSYTFKVTGVDSKDNTNTASVTIQATVK